MRNIINMIFIVVLFVCSSCEENALQDLDSDDTDASLWFEAKQLINDKNFAEAIVVLEEVSDEFKLQRQNIVQYASAYAGSCGLDLISLVNESSSLGGATPIQFFMSVFQGQTVDKIIDCQTAVEIIAVSYTHLTLPTKRIV